MALVGTFFRPITLSGSDDRAETLGGLVDTGSTFTTVPGSLLRGLGVSRFARIRLRLANGQTTDADVGEVRATLNGGAARTIICVLGEEGSPVLIGAHALESFLLGVDPDQKRLVPLEAWRA